MFFNFNFNYKKNKENNSFDQKFNFVKLKLPVWYINITADFDNSN